MYRGNERIVIASIDDKDSVQLTIHHSDLPIYNKLTDDVKKANERIEELESKLEAIKQVIM